MAITQKSDDILYPGLSGSTVASLCVWMCGCAELIMASIFFLLSRLREGKALSEIYSVAPSCVRDIREPDAVI